ncbi:sialidase family protein [Paraburkholderia sp. 31.1]|uniref:sialidase family protein n=1 Tax=Paraburkholderia sp. 31.1 TaxID=2615205 RepID=UPI00223B47FF|nr:sialidase family protein [Paraburkholderia sp. 31.1]
MKPTTPFGARNSALLVSRSVDHGASWQAPMTLIRTNSPHALNDKNSLTADPTANGYVHAVWDQLSVFPPTQAGDQMLAGNDGVEIARQLRNGAAGGAPVFKFNFTGPSFFSRSIDNGVTWSTAAPIYQPGTKAQTIKNIVRVLHDGTLRDFFTAISVTNSGLSIGYMKSTDKGASWSTPTFVNDIQVRTLGVVTPDTGQPIRDAAILFSVAVNPVTGAVRLINAGGVSEPQSPLSIRDIWSRDEAGRPPWDRRRPAAKWEVCWRIGSSVDNERKG